MRCCAELSTDDKGGRRPRGRGTRILLAALAVCAAAAPFLLAGADAYAIPVHPLRGRAERRGLTAPARPGPGTAPPTIIGGGPASNAQAYPFLGILMMEPYGFRCGATMIGPLTAMTAAHCVTTDSYYSSSSSRPNDPKRPKTHFPIESQLFSLHTYRYNQSKTAEEEGAIIYNVTAFEYHPDYDRTGNLENDVAVLFLSLFNNYGSNEAKYVALNREPSEPVPPEPLRAIGWGVSDIYESWWGGAGYYYPDILQQVDLPAVASETCEDYYNELFNDTWAMDASQLCAGERGKQPCYGDSGSALLRDLGGGEWEQVGITSFGMLGCKDPASPYSFFSRVSAVLPFVETWLSFQNGSMTRTTTPTATTTASVTRTTMTWATPTIEYGRVRVCSNKYEQIPHVDSLVQSIDVVGLGPVGDVDIELFIEHPYPQTLQAEVSSVNGDGVYAYTLLFSGPGCDDGGFAGQPITFDDSAGYILGEVDCNGTRYRPWSGINEEFRSIGRLDDPNGQWNLSVVDMAGLDYGSVGQWCLNFLPRSAMTSTTFIPTPTCEPVTVTETTTVGAAPTPGCGSGVGYSNNLVHRWVYDASRSTTTFPDCVGTADTTVTDPSKVAFPQEIINGTLHQPMEVNGTRDGLIAPAEVGAIGTTDFTITMWTKMRLDFPWNGTDESWQRWELFCNRGADDGGPYVCSRVRNYDNTVSLEIANGGHGIGVVAQSTDQLPFLDNEWHFLALVRKGADVSIFVDGLPVATETEVHGHTIDLPASTLPVGIGYSPYWGDWPVGPFRFKGRMDDVRVYYEALDTSAQGAIMDAWRAAGPWVVTTVTSTAISTTTATVPTTLTSVSTTTAVSTSTDVSTTTFVSTLTTTSVSTSTQLSTTTERSTVTSTSSITLPPVTETQTQWSTTTLTVAQPTTIINYVPTTVTSVSTSVTTSMVPTTTTFVSTAVSWKTKTTIVKACTKTQFRTTTQKVSVTTTKRILSTVTKTIRTTATKTIRTTVTKAVKRK